MIGAGPNPHVRGLGWAGLLPPRRGAGPLPRIDSNTHLVGASQAAPRCADSAPAPASAAPMAADDLAPVAAGADTPGRGSHPPRQAPAVSDAPTADSTHSTHSSAKPLGSIIIPPEAPRSGDGSHGAPTTAADGPAASEPRARKGSRLGKRKPHASPADLKPARKQQRPAGRPEAVGEDAAGLDLIGAAVQVPASVFYVDVPGLFYVGDILRRDPQRAGALEMRFRDDASLYWFPVDDVRAWVADMEARGAAVSEQAGAEMPSSVMEQAADDFAASVLTGLSAQARGGAGPAQSDAAARRLRPPAARGKQGGVR
jgi:hypothetical protein